ncbi:hypothetical protein K8I85_00630, partial [bacterium]|nr:hypothetical protein [bacterium]
MKRERWWFCGDGSRPVPGGIAAAIALSWLLAFPPAQAMDLGDGIVRLRHVSYAADPTAPGAARLPALAPGEPRHPV